MPWCNYSLLQVSSKARLFFAEVLEVLPQISEKIAKRACAKAPESVQQIADLELMLQKEKEDFEVVSMESYSICKP